MPNPRGQGGQNNFQPVAQNRPPAPVVGHFLGSRLYVQVVSSHPDGLLHPLSEKRVSQAESECGSQASR